MVMNNIEPLANIANAFFHLKTKIFKIMDASVIGKNGLRVQNVREIIISLIVVRLNFINFRIDFLLKFYYTNYRKKK